MSDHVIVIENDGDLGDRFKDLRPHRVRTEQELRTALDSVLSRRSRRIETLWIAHESKIGVLATFFREWGYGKTSMLGDLIVFGHIEAGRWAALTSVFRRVLTPSDESFRAVPLEELSEILRADAPERLAIAAAVDRDLGVLVLYRGNREKLTVPLATFKASGDGTKPNFDALAIVDHGQTIRFGNYEAAVEAILYENDREFRRLRNKERREADRSFGASLRRLRLQKGLSRDSFSGISSKEIARLERDEVRRPHEKTLKRIAARLGVRPEDIETY